MPSMQVLADETRVGVLIDQLAQAIGGDVAASGSPGGWGLVGMRSRGDVIAQRLMKRLDPQAFQGRVGSLDITLYRDDLSDIGNQPIVRTTDIAFGIDELNIVLVDDVLMTGRSVRAALQSLIDLGRPRRVWLSVLIDRGGRELPIAPEHVALDLTRDQVRSNQTVDVLMRPVDDRDAVVVRQLEHPQETGC